MEMKKFEKTIDLGVCISDFIVEGDVYRFIIKFDRELNQDDTKFTQLEQPVFDIEDDYWFEHECPRLNKDDCFGIDLFSEDTYVLFSLLFETEDKFIDIIKSMVRQFAIEKKIPNCLKSIGYEDGENLFETDDLIEKLPDGIDMNDPFEVDIVNYKGYPYKETKYKLTNNSIEIKSEIFEKNYYSPNTKQSIDYKFINDSIIDFNKNWNKEIIGKFDWSIYETYKKQKTK